VGRAATRNVLQGWQHVTMMRVPGWISYGLKVMEMFELKMLLRTALFTLAAFASGGDFS
jgi:hypothetical protein